MREREGECVGAHWEVAEELRVLGGGSEATKSRRRSRLPEEEDEGGGGSTGHPSLSTSTMRKTELLRFFQTQWMGEGGPVAVVVLVGGGGCVRWCHTESRGGEGVQGREGRGAGVLGVSMALEWVRGRRKQEGSWPRRSRARRHASAYWQMLKTAASPDGLGRQLELGQVGPGKWPSGLPSFISFCFLLFLQVCGFSINA